MYAHVNLQTVHGAIRLEKNVNKWKDEVLNHNCIKLLEYCHNFMATSCCYHIFKHCICLKSHVMQIISMKSLSLQQSHITVKTDLTLPTYFSC